MVNKKYSLLFLLFSIIGQTSAMEQNDALEDPASVALEYTESRQHLQNTNDPIEQLCTAAYVNDIQKVEALLKQKVDPNTRNYISFTPLHFAANQGNLDVCKLLIQYGANPSTTACKELFCETPLHSALSPNIPISKKNKDVAIYLIEKCNVNPNIKTELRETVLHCTALAGNVKMLKYLLQRGVHPNAINSSDLNALHLAVIDWEVQFGENLIKKSEQNIVECVKELLFAGVDHKKKSVEQKTPAYYAETELVQKILENDESVKKFMISNTTLHGKNMYKELMNRQINPRQMNPHKQELMNRQVKHDKQPMHVTKFNLERTKTLFLNNK